MYIKSHIRTCEMNFFLFKKSALHITRACGSGHVKDTAVPCQRREVPSTHCSPRHAAEAPCFRLVCFVWVSVMVDMAPRAWHNRGYVVWRQLVCSATGQRTPMNHE